MRIKGMDGHEYNVTGQGQGNFNTVGAAAGIASLLGINLNGLLGNVMNGGWNNYQNPNALAALIASMGGNMGRSDTNELIAMLSMMMPMLINCMNKGETCSDDKPISRYEAKMEQELAAKDSKIALLESNIYTDQKIADVYERLNAKINANKEEQNAINMEQAVYNGTNTATIGCLKEQIRQLQGLSELVIPRRKVCDTCNCPQ
jgi:hypothetical protein